MNYPTTPTAEMNIVLCRIARELLSRASVGSMLSEQAPSHISELAICESQVMGTISSLHDAGVAALTAEWMHELNTMAGASAFYAEDESKAEYFAGNPRVYALIWNQFAHWTYHAQLAA